MRATCGAIEAAIHAVDAELQAFAFAARGLVAATAVLFVLRQARGAFAGHHAALPLARAVDMHQAPLHACFRDVPRALPVGAGAPALIGSVGLEATRIFAAVGVTALEQALGAAAA